MKYDIDWLDDSNYKKLENPCSANYKNETLRVNKSTFDFYYCPAGHLTGYSNKPKDDDNTRKKLKEALLNNENNVELETKFFRKIKKWFRH